MIKAHPRWFVRGDLDGFFALFIDNLLQLMLISVLCAAPFIAFPDGFVTHTILPGAAISILFGNLFYTWQAYNYARRHHRDDVAALPYGINTVSLFAYVFFIMVPAYQETKDPMVAWRLGLAATLLGGLMEIGGAFVGDWVRKNTPRAALLAALSGIAITFISMPFIFQMFAAPAIAMLPMIIILIGYGSGLKFPGGIPAGLLAVVLGAGLTWVVRAFVPEVWTPPALTYAPGVHLPFPYPEDAFAMLLQSKGWEYMAVIIPMALFNIIGSLQNLESAEAAGDHYDTRSSLLTNGLGSVVAALFGSPFPTTIYIGHPGWKAMGARVGYSALNGIVITVLVLVGAVDLIRMFVPLEVTLGILLWIGLIITAQAFQEVPGRHAPAVAIGLIPCLAGWAFLLVDSTLLAAGTNLYATIGKFGQALYIHGLIALSQGFILTSMVFAAMLVHIIDRKFLHAAAWAVAAAGLAAIGIMHAYEVTPNGLVNVIGLRSPGGGFGLASPQFFVAYLIIAGALVAAHYILRPRPLLETAGIAAGSAGSAEVTAAAAAQAPATAVARGGGDGAVSPAAQA